MPYRAARSGDRRRECDAGTDQRRHKRLGSIGPFWSSTEDGSRTHFSAISASPSIVASPCFISLGGGFLPPPTRHCLYPDRASSRSAHRNGQAPFPRVRGSTGSLSAWSALALGVPTFWLGILLILLFAVELQMAAIGLGLCSFWESPLQMIRNVSLPALTLGVYVSGILARSCGLPSSAN